ncbi:MAG TPA: 30S ribosomal protein S16 [Candidatus Magasanikbacteria bacterium]|nr:30S ribosomal protein S16 [Candidatus Magasanikbacteria bacterium]
MSLAVFLVFDFRMLVLRLQRIGKKKKPSYRLIVSEKSKDPQAKNLEILGLYHPVQKETMIELKKERIMHWLSLGAQASPTVHNLLVNAGVLTGQKKKSVAISQKRQKKLDEKKAALAAKEEASQKAAGDAKAAEVAQKATAVAAEQSAVEPPVAEPTPSGQEQPPEAKEAEAA